MLLKHIKRLFLLTLMVLPPYAFASADGQKYDMRNSRDNIAGLDGILTGGQPTIADLELLKEEQFSTIINLRTPTERINFDEAKAVDELGMEYVSIPISNSGDLTLENIMKLNNSLNGAEGNVLIHCASGNRVGAILALRAYHVDGYSVENALALGSAAGMTKLHGAIKSILETMDNEK